MGKGRQTNSVQKPYTEGWSFGLSSMPVRNPYVKNTKYHDAWQRGYDASTAQRKQRTKTTVATHMPKMQ